MLKKIIAFNIIWISSGLCFYFHHYGMYMYGYLVALPSCFAFLLMNSKENINKDKKGSISYESK